jgi:glycosyltransferase involved in cell wall biosynthesis
VDRVTFGVKTLLRPHLLRRLVASARAAYPAVPWVIVDDSPAAHPDVFAAADLPAGSKYVRLPFDSGLGAGRNRMAAEVETPYCLYLDDDFVFTPETKVERFVAVLDAAAADLVGGACRDPGRTRQYHGLLVRDGETLVFDRAAHPGGGVVAGVPIDYVDITVNFFLARSDALRRVGWDPELKVNTHVEFFLRAKDELRIAYTPAVAVGHRPERPPGYRELRGRRYFDLALAKHGVKRCVYKGQW